MARDLIARRPWLSTLILIVGAVICAILSMRAITRRGYPRIDPLYMSMAWLWVFPLLLSAIWDKLSLRRAGILLLYALFVAFIYAGVHGAVSIPRHMTLAETVFLAPFFLPVGVGLVAAVELAGQFVLHFARRLRPPIKPGICSDCGYPITQLGHPECPECGRPFDEKSLLSLYDPTEGGRPVRTWVYAAVVVIAMFLFPLAYRSGNLSWHRQKACAWAEAKWARFQIAPPDSAGDPQCWTEFFPIGHFNETSGLEMHGRMSSNTAYTGYQAYRSVFEEEFATNGFGPLADFLFTDEEFVSLASGGHLKAVDSFPFAFKGGMVVLSEGGQFTEMHSYYGNVEPANVVRHAVVEEKNKVLVVMTERHIATFHPEDGMLLQFIDLKLHDLGIAAESLRTAAVDGED